MLKTLNPGAYYSTDKDKITSHYGSELFTQKNAIYYIYISHYKESTHA